MPSEPGWPAVALGGVILGALILYALFGGADFGGGVWHLLARGPRARRQRALIVGAIGPIWEANHVWLILVVVVLFTGFPAAFAALGIRLHAPLLALLLAIVVRGAAFAFRAAAGDRPAEQRGWDAAFQLASVAAPVLLGVTIGALVSGGAAGTGPAAPGPSTWPFAIAVGLFALALFAFLAAVYLTVDAAGDRALQDDFRARALAAGGLCGALAIVTFVLSAAGAPLIHRGLSVRRWSLPLHALTAAAAVTALAALWRRRFRAARVAAAAQVSLIVLGWGASQYPLLLPPDLTLSSAAAPLATQRLLLGALAAGAVVLFPSLWLMFRVFKRVPREDRASEAVTEEAG